MAKAWIIGRTTKTVRYIDDKRFEYNTLVPVSVHLTEAGAMRHLETLPLTYIVKIQGSALLIDGIEDADYYIHSAPLID